MRVKGKVYGARGKEGDWGRAAPHAGCAAPKTPGESTPLLLISSDGVNEESVCQILAVNLACFPSSI